MRTKRVTIQLDAVQELLRRGGQRLRPPGVWLQGRQSATAEGEPTAPESLLAKQWCCLGALRREALDICGGQFEGPARLLYDAAASKMAEALVQHLDCRRMSRDPPTALAYWNDAGERTQDDVVDLFALAA